MEQVLKAVPEPKNVVDKYPVCVMLSDEIVEHLKKGRSGRFAKTVFYFLRADEKGSCTAIVKGKAVNLGDGKGMQVPCTLHFKGTKKFIDVLRQQLQKNNYIRELLFCNLKQSLYMYLSDRWQICGLLVV